MGDHELANVHPLFPVNPGGKFDYFLIAATSDRADVAAAAKRIFTLGRQCQDNVFEIGRELTLAKAKAGHGNFIKWIKAEFGWRLRSAQRYMQIYDALEEMRPAVAHLPVKLLSDIASPRTPDAIRTWIASEAEKGTKAKASAISSMIKSARLSREAQVEAVNNPPRRPPSVATAQRAADLVVSALQAEELGVLADCLEKIDGRTLLHSIKVAVKQARSSLSGRSTDISADAMADPAVAVSHLPTPVEGDIHANHI